MPACLELENEHYGIVVFTLLFPVVLDPLLKTFPRTHYFFLVAVAEINAWHIFFAIFFCIFSPKIAKKNWVLIDPNFPIFFHFCHFKLFFRRFWIFWKWHLLVFPYDLSCDFFLLSFRFCVPKMHIFVHFAHLFFFFVVRIPPRWGMQAAMLFAPIRQVSRVSPHVPVSLACVQLLH